MIEETIKEEIDILESPLTINSALSNINPEWSFEFTTVKSPSKSLPVEFPHITRKTKLYHSANIYGKAQANHLKKLIPSIEFRTIPLHQNVPCDITSQIPKVLVDDPSSLMVLRATTIPYPLPESLKVVALIKPEDETDSLISKNRLKLADLPFQAKIGVSEYYNTSELKLQRPDLITIKLSENIEKCFTYLDKGTIEAFIIETEALKRLSMEYHAAEILHFETHPLNGYMAVIGTNNSDNDFSAFQKIDVRNQYGTVSLVGFGPGDPGLQTIKGESLVKNADIIFYDHLINREYLNRYTGTKVYVGKRSKNHSFSQERINRLLYNAAIEGKQVVRLKGGDPMIFAHGGEEIEYLKKNFVNVSVVPGITAAVAASAITHIPLTHRDITSSVTFVSGHDPDKIDFTGNTTIAVYMGTGHSKEIALKAIKQGRALQTPVLLISNISNTNQETQKTNLEILSNTNIELKTPLLMIIGNVVDVNTRKTEIKNKPSIWITGTSPETFNNTHQIIHIPLIKRSLLKDYSTLNSHLERLTGFDLLVFTSKHLVSVFFNQLFETGRDVRTLSKTQIVSFGKNTTLELLKFGLIPDIDADDESTESLLKEFKKQEIKDKNILIPGSNHSLPTLPESLTDLGNKVTSVVIYNNEIPDSIQLPHPENYDAIFFSSPSCIENFISLGLSLKTNKKFIVQGNPTFFKLIFHGVNPSQIYSKKDFETTMFYI